MARGAALRPRSLRICAGILCASYSVLAPCDALGQIPPEIPLTNRLGVGTRALGMGGAYVAVAEDYHALEVNPGGLSQVGRIEFGGELENRTALSRTRYGASSRSSELDKSRIQSFGFAYPFPTYRGSMAVGLAFEGVIPLDQDYLRRGSGPGILDEREVMLEDGRVGSYVAGFSVATSPRVKLGFAARYLSGSSYREHTFDFDGEAGGEVEHRTSRSEMDISAVSGSLGTMVALSSSLRLGLVIHLPEHFTISGQETRRSTFGDGEGAADTVETVSFEDEVNLPYRLALGLSFQHGLLDPAGGGSILLAADASLVDWKEIDWLGPIRIENEDGRVYAYRSTLDVRAGAELTLPRVPLRLRFGFASLPVAYDLIGTDVYSGVAARPEFVPDRRYWTAGAGILVEDSLVLDLAIIRGKYERRGTAPSGLETTESLNDERVYLSATYRL